MVRRVGALGCDFVGSTWEKSFSLLAKATAKAAPRLRSSGLAGLMPNLLDRFSAHTFKPPLSMLRARMRRQ